MADDNVVDDDDSSHWQPGQPWQPRRRSEAAPRPWETPVEPTPAVRPEVRLDHSERAASAVTPGAEEPGRQRDLGSSPSPLVRPDATVLMPIIPGEHGGARPAAPTDQPTGPAAASPPPPPASPPPAPTPQRPGKRRSRTRRFLGRLLVLVAVIAVILGLGAFWVEGQLQRVETPSAGGGPGPETFLIVGSDSRENLPDDLEGNFGSFGGQRADVIILAQVVDGTVRMLSLPRDLKVEIPGEGTDKVNAAYAYGGPDLLIRTIQQDLGIPVDRYVDVEFGGFASIVDAVGGVELTFDYPTRDLKSGLEVDAGTQLVDGATALAYVRSRSTEEFRDGDWRSADGGDIARTGRQREVLEGIIGRALTPAGLIRIPAMIPSVTSAVRVGDTTHSWNLGAFAFRFVTASSNQSIALPVTGATVGGVSYVVRTEEATPVIRAFVSGDPLPIEDAD